MTAVDRRNAGVSRRDVLHGGLWWFPFFRPSRVELAGARFRIVRYANSKRRYVVIHGNEETAREVVLAHMRSRHGVTFIVEGSARNVPIEGGVIDPNRMFSRVGAKISLERLNPAWTAPRIARALDVLDRGRERLVRVLLAPRDGLTVALHNNSQSYSVRDEQPISDAASIREPHNPHAFFLCTDESDFRTLSESAYNVVLQRNAPPEDDGSLSRLAAARGVRYVNLEVGHGHSARQKEMLDWLDWVLPEDRKRT